MTILGTLLATTLLAFIWFFFGSRETDVENSVEKKKDEMENMNSENLFINNSQTSIASKTNILRTANSWKLNEISSIQNSHINSPLAGNSSDIQELQCTKNSTVTEKKDDSVARIDTRNKSTYFSARIPSESYLPSLDCTAMSKSLENLSIDGEWSSAVSVKDGDSSSNIISLSSLETGITVTDMTAEIPSVLNPIHIPVIELSDLIESMSSVEDKIGAVENNDLMLQSVTATNASFETNLKTKYSITKLRSNDDITSFSDTDTHGDNNMKTDSISDYTLMNKYHLANKYCNSDSEIVITEGSQKKEFDHITTAEL